VFDDKLAVDPPPANPWDEEPEEEAIPVEPLVAIGLTGFTL